MCIRDSFLREKELDRERHVHRKRAMHDELTSLPNRALLIDRIEQVIFCLLYTSSTIGCRYVVTYFISPNGRG